MSQLWKWVTGSASNGSSSNPDIKQLKRVHDHYEGQQPSASPPQYQLHHGDVDKQDPYKLWAMPPLTAGAGPVAGAGAAPLPEPSHLLSPSEVDMLHKMLYQEDIGLAYVDRDARIHSIHGKYHMNRDRVLHLLVHPLGVVDVFKVEAWVARWAHVVRQCYYNSHINGLDVILTEVPRSEQPDHSHAAPPFWSNRSMNPYMAHMPLGYLQCVPVEKLFLVTSSIEVEVDDVHGQKEESAVVRGTPSKDGFLKAKVMAQPPLSKDGRPVHRVSQASPLKPVQRQQLDLADSVPIAKLTRNMCQLLRVKDLEPIIRHRPEMVNENKVMIYSLGFWTKSGDAMVFAADALRQALDPGLGNMTDVCVDMKHKGIIIEFLATCDAVRGDICLVQKISSASVSDPAQSLALRENMEAMLLKIAHVPSEPDPEVSSELQSAPVEKPAVRGKMAPVLSHAVVSEDAFKKPIVFSGGWKRQREEPVDLADSLQNHVAPKFGKHRTNNSRYQPY